MSSLIRGDGEAGRGDAKSAVWRLAEVLSELSFVIVY